MAEIKMTFLKAMKELMEGAKVTRLDWKDKNIYCLIANTYLMISNHDKMDALILRDSDIYAEDWVVIE